MRVDTTRCFKAAMEWEHARLAGGASTMSASANARAAKKRKLVEDLLDAAKTQHGKRFHQECLNAVKRGRKAALEAPWHNAYRKKAAAPAREYRVNKKWSLPNYKTGVWTSRESVHKDYKRLAKHYLKSARALEKHAAQRRRENGKGDKLTARWLREARTERAHARLALDRAKRHHGVYSRDRSRGRRR